MYISRRYLLIMEKMMMLDEQIERRADLRQPYYFVFVKTDF